MSKRQQKRREARDAKYTLGVDLGAASGDYSAYVVMRRDPVREAIEIVATRAIPEVGEEAKRIIREDLERFGYQLSDDHSLFCPDTPHDHILHAGGQKP